MEEDGPLQWMQRRVGSWLSSAEKPEQPRQLERWLEGYDLPAVGHEEEPYVWIVRGLPVGADRFRAETELASRAAALLDAEPDRVPVGERPAQVLYNLLMLCTRLSCPDHLGEPLWRMLLRRCLAGTWRGSELRGALRSALVENQLDARLERTWFSMLEGRESDFLSNDPYDAFVGIVQMPSATRGRGIPAVEAIGRALALLAKVLERDVEYGRRREFRRYLVQVCETYPGRQWRWHRDLLAAADREAWPRWGVQCLPSLFVPWKDGAARQFAVWRLYWKHLLGEPTVEQELCGGEVVIVYLAAEDESVLNKMMPQLEAARLATSEDSERAVIGSVLHELQIIEEEQSLAGDRLLAQAVKSGRESLLDYEDIMAVAEACRP